MQGWCMPLSASLALHHRCLQVHPSRLLVKQGGLGVMLINNRHGHGLHSAHWNKDVAQSAVDAVADAMFCVKQQSIV